MNKLTIIRLRIIAIIFALLMLQGVLNERDTATPQCHTDTQCELNDYR